LLGLTGGTAGLLIAWRAATVGMKFVPPEAGVLQLNLAPDPSVLFFAFSISILAAVGCGLLPALHAMRRDLTPCLKTEGLLDSAARRRNWLQMTLGGVQVAVSVVLLVNAGLMVRGFSNVAQVSRNRAMDNLLIASFDLRQQQYGAEKAERFHGRMVQKLAATPGIEAVSVSLLQPEVSSNNTRAHSVGP